MQYSHRTENQTIGIKTIGIQSNAFAILLQCIIRLIFNYGIHRWVFCVHFAIRTSEIMISVWFQINSPKIIKFLSFTNKQLWIIKYLSCAYYRSTKNWYLRRFCVVLNVASIFLCFFMWDSPININWSVCSK